MYKLTHSIKKKIHLQVGSNIRTLGLKEDNFPLLEWKILDIKWEEAILEVISRYKNPTKEKIIITKLLKDIRIDNK